MDGVNQLNNILVIGMTNRKDLIDDALLRPGRLEVQTEISLPDEKGLFSLSLNLETSSRPMYPPIIEPTYRKYDTIMGAIIAGGGGGGGGGVNHKIKSYKGKIY